MIVAAFLVVAQSLQASAGLTALDAHDGDRQLEATIAGLHVNQPKPPVGANSSCSRLELTMKR